VAQRAKLIKTRAILNEDTNGSLEQLRAEIKRLKAEVAAAKSKQAGAEVGQARLLCAYKSAAAFACGRAYLVFLLRGLLPSCI